MVLTLVGGGAHLDFRNKKGMTALHKAVLVKNPSAVKVVYYKSYKKNKKSTLFKKKKTVLNCPMVMPIISDNHKMATISKTKDKN